MANPNVIAFFEDPKRIPLSTENIGKAGGILHKYERDESVSEELLGAVKICAAVDAILVMFQSVWSRVLAPKIRRARAYGAKGTFEDRSLRIEIRRNPHCVVTIGGQDRPFAIFFANLENGQVDFLGGDFDAETLGNLIIQIAERAGEIFPEAEAFG